MVYRGSVVSWIGNSPRLDCGKEGARSGLRDGQNSLLLAAQFSESLTLVEPNPTGMRHIVEQYENLKILMLSLYLSNKGWKISIRIVVMTSLFAKTGWVVGLTSGSCL